MHLLISERLFIALTLLLALMLELLPLPGWSIWLRPEWILLISIYWLITRPSSIGLLFAFFVGILLDLSHGTLLGEHVIAMVAVAFFIIKFNPSIRVRQIIPQSLMVLSLITFYKSIIFILQGFINQLPHPILYWSSIVTSALLWPWISIILHERQGGKSELLR